MTRGGSEQGRGSERLHKSSKWKVEEDPHIMVTGHNHKYQERGRDARKWWLKTKRKSRADYETRNNILPTDTRLEGEKVNILNIRWQTEPVDGGNRQGLYERHKISCINAKNPPKGDQSLATVPPIATDDDEHNGGRKVRSGTRERNSPRN